MSTTSQLLAFVLLACSPLAAFAAAPPPIEVTTCGQAIPRRTVGYLTADLDCTGYDGAPGAIMLGRKATLELRGHRVTGGRFAVLCGELRPDRFGDIRLYIDSRCTVIGGGGVVSAAESHGVAANELAISDVTIENSGQVGIYTRKKAVVENVTVTGSARDGMRLSGRAVVRGSTVTDSGENGVSSERKLQVFGSTVVGNGMGPSCTYAWGCVDIRSVVRPLVVDTTCNTSLALPNGNWGVCTLD